MEKCLRWIVLADLHMGIKNSKSEAARKKLIKTIQDEALIKQFDFILLAGDCMNQSELSGVVEYIKELKEAAKIKNFKNVYITPGNHDITRSPKKGSDRYRALVELRKWNTEIDDLEKTEYHKAYSKFSDLYNEIRGEKYIPFSIFEPVDMMCRIINIDTCLLSNDDNDAGKLKVCFSKLQNIQIKDDERLNIVLMHHGVDFLETSDSLEFQQWMADNHVDIIFCGHNHSVGVAELLEAVDQEGKYDPIRQFTCGACHGFKTMIPTMFICEQKDLEKIQVKFYQFNTDQSWDVAIHSRRSFPGGINEYNLPSRHERFVTYGNIKEAYGDIARDVQSCKKFCFMGIQGTALLPFNRVTIYDSLKMLNSSDVQVLIANPTEHYLEERLKTLPTYKEQALLRKHMQNIYKRGIELDKKIFV